MTKNNTIITDPTTSAQAAVDRAVGALSVIATGHHEVHEGEMFVLSQILTATTSYLITVPTGVEMHLVFEAFTDAAQSSYLELYPLVTTSADGTAFTQIFNKKSAGGATGTVTIKTAPTVTSTLDATTRSFYGMLAVAGQKCGGLDREQYEYILTAGKHLLRVTRGSGNITLQAQWYEEAV